MPAGVKKKIGQLHITMDYEIIETREELDRLVPSLLSQKRIAVDLESDSMYHFREKICLIQISITGTNVLIDPLKIDDISGLKEVFRQPGIQKIFHGADYDIRSLYRDFGIEVCNLFDTELACRFTGARETGLDTVLDHYFSVKLDKKFQRKDWSVRPLPVEMLDYAANDTIYLIPLARLMENELKKLGRRSWVKEECELLSRVRPNHTGDHPLFTRFRGAGKLKPRHLAVLEALLHFRMAVAEKKDRPPFKVMSNHLLIKIAQNPPASIEDMKRRRMLSKKQFEMYGVDIFDRIEKAMELSDDDLPVYPRKKSPRLKFSVSERIRRLKQWRIRKGEQLKIDPALICPKSAIASIALENPGKTRDMKTVDGLRNWQRKAFGKELIQVLKNENA